MRLTLRIVMTAFVVAVPAPATAQSSRPRVRLVEASRIVPPNGSATFAARCPASDPHPVGGEFDTSSAGALGKLALAASYPRGTRAWVVVVRNLSDRPQPYLAGIICVGATAQFAYPRTTYVVRPAGADGSSVGCPTGAPHSLGGYFNVQSSADLDKIVLANYGSYQHGSHEFGEAGVKSASSAPVRMYGGAVCTSLRTQAYGYDGTVAPGAHDGQSSSCLRPTPVAVGGFAYAQATSDNGAIFIAAMGNLHRQGYALLSNPSDHSVPYSAGALCVG